MEVDGRPILIDEPGARWAYTLGFWKIGDCPFIEGTPHYLYYWRGYMQQRFSYEMA